MNPSLRYESLSLSYESLSASYESLSSTGERRSFTEDLDDLESEAYTCEQKLLVLQRIYRTQPTLLAAGPGRVRLASGL